MDNFKNIVSLNLKLTKMLKTKTGEYDYLLDLATKQQLCIDNMKYVMERSTWFKGHFKNECPF